MGKNDANKKSSKLPKILIVLAVICVIGMFGNGKNKNKDAKKTDEPTTAVATTQKSTEVATEKKTVEASTENSEPSLYDQLSELKGKTVKEGMKALNDTGYTIQYLNQGEDFTDFIESFSDNIIKLISCRKTFMKLMM